MTAPPPRHRRPRSRATLTRDVAPGVHRLAHTYVDCYLVEHDGAVTVVDAALPATWRFVERALTVIGRRPADVSALVLTHAHFDHLGFARRAREEWRVPVHVHRADAGIAAHPSRYAHERPRALFPLQHPAALPILGAMTAAGALRVPGVHDAHLFDEHDGLGAPGPLEVVFSPGHTAGHCGLLVAGRDVLLPGDALVTLDPRTGERGPRIVAGAATADSAANLASLDAFVETGARLVLPGHGEPWRGGVEQAVSLARTAGLS